MRETKVFTTEDHAYQVTKLAADKEGLAALLRAQKLAVKAAGGLESMISELSEEDLNYFCDLFAKYTKIIQGDKKPALSSIFSVHFGGNWFELLKWLSFCLGFNFGPFFIHMVKDGAELRAAAVEGAGAVAEQAEQADESTPAQE